MLSFIIIRLVCQPLPSPSTTAQLIMIMVANFVWCILGIWAPTCSEYANAADLLLGLSGARGQAGRGNLPTAAAANKETPRGGTGTKSRRHRGCPRRGVPLLVPSQQLSAHHAGVASPWFCLVRARWSTHEQQNEVATRARAARWCASARPCAMNAPRATPALPLPLRAAWSAVVPAQFCQPDASKSVGAMARGR